MILSHYNIIQEMFKFLIVRAKRILLCVAFVCAESVRKQCYSENLWNGSMEIHSKDCGDSIF
jgi:hypothetical protein